MTDLLCLDEKFTRMFVCQIALLLVQGCPGGKEIGSDKLKIDNKYFPLKPGTTFVYKRTSDGEQTRDVFKVTDKVKVILGITKRVVHDDAFVNGEHGESTDDWFAREMFGILENL